MHVHSADLRTLRDIGFYTENYDAVQRQLWGNFCQDRNAAHLGEILDFLLCDIDADLSRLQCDDADACYLQNFSNIRKWTVRVSARDQRAAGLFGHRCGSERNALPPSACG